MAHDAFTFFKDQFGLIGVLIVLFGLGLYLLAVDLAKLRTTMQQQMASNLLDQRFKAYEELWTKLGKLALYSTDRLSASDAEALRNTLSSWYFSAQGGMYLSARARDFYFALQEALNAASQLKTWVCSHRPSDPSALAEGFLSSVLADSDYSDFDPATLDDPLRMKHGLWLEVCKCAAERLKTLEPADQSPNNEVVFAFLQQVSSALRTVLAADLQSRLDLNVPRVSPMWSK